MAGFYGGAALGAAAGAAGGLAGAAAGVVGLAPLGAVGAGYRGASYELSHHPEKYPELTKELKKEG